VGGVQRQQLGLHAITLSVSFGATRGSGDPAECVCVLIRVGSTCCATTTGTATATDPHGPTRSVSQPHDLEAL
jgi:hypothetical protein